MRHLSVFLLIIILALPGYAKTGALECQAEEQWGDRGFEWTVSGRCASGEAANSWYNVFYDEFKGFVRICEGKAKQLLQGRCKPESVSAQRDVAKQIQANRETAKFTYNEIKRNRQQVERFRESCSDSFKNLVNECIQARDQAMNNLTRMDQMTCTMVDISNAQQDLRKLASTRIQEVMCQLLETNFGSRMDEQNLEMNESGSQQTGSEISEIKPEE